MPKVKKSFLKLQYYRKRYGFRQEDFAVLLGMTISGYSFKERGISPIAFDEMIKLRNAINCKAEKAGEEKLSLDDIFLD